jgi:hypothetical protein
MLSMGIINQIDILSTIFGEWLTMKERVAFFATLPSKISVQF